MKKGFSFVEIMVVVGIIALLSALVIPNLLRSRLTANEQYAISNIQTISVAAQTYWSVTNSLPATLNQLYSGSYIDATLGGCGAACCTKNGYTYCMEGTGLSSDFYVYAIPETPGVTGERSFCSVSDGVIRVDPSGATPGSKTACSSLSPL